jgi:methionyl aminopeptidase
MFRKNVAARALRPVVTQRNQERVPPVLKSPREIQIMREAGRIVARVHAHLRQAIRPGINTWDIDQQAVTIIQKYGAVSAFWGYKGYPGNVCTSINSELVHGIPKKNRILQEGDIISVDVGVNYRGFIGDSAWTYAVGNVSAQALELMGATEQSLYEGIRQAVVGNKIVEISRAVQRCIDGHNLHVVREYTGHGVGRQMHESPQVLNYDGDDVDGSYVLRPGLVLAIEPMVQRGTWETKILKDKWTVVSKDGSLAAHFEHTVAITNNGPEILTVL